MNNFLAKVKNIYAVLGYRRASLYLLSIIPEKIGIGIVEVFLHKNSSHMAGILADRSFTVIDSFAKLGEQDQLALLDCSGSKVKRLFRRGYLCAMGRIDNKLGCICWIKPVRHYFLSRKRADFLFSTCFTSSDMRGRGLFPETLGFACNFLKKENKQDLKVIIESTVFNYPSLSGIQKAGFLKDKVAIMFFGLRVYF